MRRKNALLFYLKRGWIVVEQKKAAKIMALPEETCMFRNKRKQGSNMSRKCGLNATVEQLNVKSRGNLNGQSKRM